MKIPPAKEAFIPDIPEIFRIFWFWLFRFVLEYSGPEDPLPRTRILGLDRYSLISVIFHLKTWFLGGPFVMQTSALFYCKPAIFFSFFLFLFWPGIVRNFMQYLPVTLIITLGASLLVAFVMNPVFAVDFMVRDEHLQVPKRSSFVKWAIAYVVIALLSYLGGFNGLGTFALILLLSHASYQFFLYKTIRNFKSTSIFGYVLSHNH